MSCQYYVVDSEKANIKESILAIIDDAKKKAVQALDNVKVSDGGELPETVKEELARALDNVQYAVDWGEKLSIGTRTSSGFIWDDFSGFLCLEDLLRYLKERPQCRIQDEYGTVMELNDFQKNLS